MVVIKKRSVRATSVPVGRYGEDFGSDATFHLMDANNTATARRISNFALDDTDAMVTASKRHDRQLLSDINSRLANASFTQPQPASTKRSTVTSSTHHHHQLNKPPLPPGRHHRYLAHDDDDDLPPMPATPVTSSVIRSSSVPPRLPVSVSGHHHHAPARRSHVVTRVDSHVGPGNVYYQHAVPVYGQVDIGNRDVHLLAYEPPPLSSAAVASLTPVADLAVRQAHRSLDRINKELKFTYDHPNGPHGFSSKTYVAEVQPVMGRGRSSGRSVASHLHHYGPLVTSSRTTRTASLSPGRTNIIQRRATSPLPSELLFLTMSPPPPSSPSPLSSHSQTPVVLPSDLQMKVDLTKSSKIESESPLLLTNLYKLRTDPALPVSAVYVAPPRSSHVAADVISTPLSPPRAKVHSFDYPLPQPVMNVRPKVSETRRKVREVLCKVKKDPHYFD